jgi:hypothetical protein
MALRISTGAYGNSNYPTDRIQKGLVLLSNGEDLSEEAVGFGVPILKRGLQAIFPGEVELYPQTSSLPTEFSARYKMNLVEKIARSDDGILNNRYLYASKNLLAALIRRLPIIRKLLTGTSNLLRASFDLKTTYEPGEYFTFVAITYSIDPAKGRIKVALIGQDFIPGSINEIIMMNEQGAHHFDMYEEANGELKHGKQIGCWDEVAAQNAAFISSRQRISFSLPQVKGSKLYSGRELIGTRLAWSGFGYSLPPNLEHFSYEISLRRVQ